MDLFRRLLCLLLTAVYRIDADYILTDQEYTWSQANEVCTLATPNLSFSLDGTLPVLDKHLSEDVWLGYVENMTPFEYFACAKKDYLDLDSADYITEGDPGQCWSACKNVEAVAVYRNECYCLQNVNAGNIKRMGDRCDLGCPNQPNIVCGGYSLREYVSLYKTTYTGAIGTSNSDSNICLWYDITSKTFFWGRCTDKYRVVCYKDQNVWLYNGIYGDWITMTTKCFRDDGIPSSYNNTNNVNTSETANMWTGVIRNDVIYPVTDFPNVLAGKYGYFSVETGKLLFTNNVTVTKRAVCVEGTIVTDETRTQSTITTSADYTPGHTTDGTTNQRSSTGENTADEKQSLKEESSNVGLIVGVTLSIIIVIIVAVVIIVLWKRGVKLPFVKNRMPDKLHEQAANHTTNVSGHDNPIQGTSEADGYEEVDVTNISSGKNMIPNNDDNRARINNDEAHTYRNLENNVIDVAHTYSNVENNTPGEDHTYQNQENKTLDEAHTYLGLQNITPDDHTYSGLEVGKPLPKQQ